MSLRYIGKSKNRPIYLVKHAEERCIERGISFKDIIEAISSPHVTYRDKIRSKLKNGKDIFLGVKYDTNKIIIITAGVK